MHVKNDSLRNSILCAAAAILCLLADLAPAQNSQFLFDDNGNLLVQTAETIAPPQIIGQPQNRIVAPAETAAFTVVVAYTRALGYQWRFNGTNISGATNDAVVLQNVSTNNEGEYTVRLTNPSGSVTSAPAMLWFDGNGNGMADSWELTYFTNLNQLPNGDFDGDGSSNLQEFLDGIDPANSNSVRFHLTVVREGGSVIKVPDQPSYTNGETVTLTATASSNETFHAWIGDMATRSNSVTLVMTNNKTMYARFTSISFLWTNEVSGDWNTATNWTPNLAPGSNDNVAMVIGVTVTLNTPADCNDVFLGGGFLGGGFDTPTLTGSGTLTVRGNFLWAAGTMSGSGRTVISTGATLSLADASFRLLSRRTLENGGTVLWPGAGEIGIDSGAVITNRAGALFHVQNAATFSSGAGVNRFDNAGTFRKSANAGTTTVGVNFNNSGTVEIQTGTLSLGGGGTNSGSIEVPAGTALTFSGGTYTAGESSSITGAGQFTVNGATATLAGLVNVSGSNTVNNGTANLTGDYICTNNTLTIAGTANFSGTGTVSPALLDLSNGTLDGTSTVTVANVMNWTAGTMSGSGRTLISPEATLTIANPGSVSLISRTLENGGTVLWTGGGDIAMNSGAVLTNRAGALFLVENAGNFSFSSGANRFDNAGAFRKSASAGTTTVANGVSFNNSGTVEIQTGTLNLGTGGGTHSGSFVVPTGAALMLGGSHNAGVGSSITGAGQLTVNNGASTLAGLVNVTGSNTFSGGVANLTGNTICTNNTVTISGGTANFSGTGTVSPAVLSLSSGTLDGTSTVTVNNAMNWTGGAMSGSGRTIIPGGVTLNIPNSSAVSLTTRTLENGGTVLWTGAGSIFVSSGAVITNRAGALFHVQNAAALGTVGNFGRFDNAGTFRKSVSAGTTTVANGMTFNNSGTVDLQTGTLLCNGFFVNNGAVNLSAGTTNRFANGGLGSGQFIAPATALVEWNAGFTLNSGAQLNGAGLYKINGGTVTANADLTVENLDLVSSSSTLDGAGMVTIANVMNWTAGGMSGSGRTIIFPGATLAMANPGAVFLSRTLENSGTTLWTGAGNINLAGAVITNRAGALFHAQNAATLSFAGVASRFDNAGTFRKSANTGTTTVGSGVSFNNSGTVDIRSGILAANGGYVSSPSALLNCALGGTTPGTNYGQFQVAGTVTLNGALSVDLINGFVPAVNDSFTVLTAGTRNGTFGNFFYPSNVVTMQLSNTTSSVLVRVTAISAVAQPTLLPPVLSGTNVSLIWTSVSNVTYRVEYNPDLNFLNASNWTALPGDVPGISNTASKLDTLTPSNRFYRVRILP